MDYAKESLRLHAKWKGKIEVISTVPVESKDDLSLAYTPGVAQPCLEIQKDIKKSYELTRRHNLCAVITDGSAVLGLGDIGPEAGMPVMEGKCVLFKSFGGVDAFHQWQLPVFIEVDADPEVHLGSALIRLERLGQSQNRIGGDQSDVLENGHVWASFCSAFQD